MRFLMLVYAYLAVILGAFVAPLTGAAAQISTRLVLCFGLAALIWTMSLPVVIYRVQRDRLDEEVRRRKNAPTGADEGELEANHT